MDVDSSSKSGASSMVPLGLGLLGLVIGAIALFMSFSNSSAITSLKTLNDTVTAVSSKADAAKATADSLAGKVADDANQIAALRSNMTDYVNTANPIIKQHDQDIADLKKQLAGHSTAARSGTSTGDTSTAVAGQGGMHVVASGDTLGNIAKKYGVSLADLEAANPGVDSAHLKIGQHITIPAAHSAGTSTRSTRSAAGAGTSAPAPTSSGAPATAVSP